MSVVSRQNREVALASCGASDGVGSLVYIKGPAVGDKYSVETADPSDFDKMPAIGMIIQKPSATECFVQFRGRISGVYAGLTPGELLFVDDSGLLAALPPDPEAGTPKFMQNVGVSLSDGDIELSPNRVMAKRRL